MIERKIVEQRMKELKIQEYIAGDLKNSGLSHIKVQRTPLGEKIVVYTARPGMIVGRKGQNIKKLTTDLKREYQLENPQIEIAEVENINLDARIVAERIAMSLERFGSQRFKGVAHKVLTDVMAAGALGIEVTISGKVPSMRAKTWRFFSGYLKKCGDIAISGVHHAYATALLKSGVIGIQVSIMPPTTKRPDDVKIRAPEELQQPASGSVLGASPSKLVAGEVRAAGDVRDASGEALQAPQAEQASPSKAKRPSRSRKKADKQASEGKPASETPGEKAAEKQPRKKKETKDMKEAVPAAAIDNTAAIADTAASAGGQP
ncbi:30S ribosomal protein S3 [Candidatus Woesearchaeota archaeon]|nr:30S ribosomal protein S3 [Candidatus Woesearchaeota archaeon]